MIISPYKNLNPFGRKLAGDLELYLSANALRVSDDLDATTGLTSNIIGGNTFESQQVIKNGSLAAIHIESNVAPANGARCYQDISSLLTIGVEYTFSVDLGHVGSGGSWTIGIGTANSNVSGKLIKTIINSETTFVTYSEDMIYDGTQNYFVCREVGSNDGGIYVDNFSIKVK